MQCYNNYLMGKVMLVLRILVKLILWRMIVLGINVD